MIFEKGELTRYSSEIEIPQIGGEVRKGFSDVVMHTETGVVFIGRFYRDTSLEKFVVGKLNADGGLDDVREFTGGGENDFVEATKYFEELIKKNKQDVEPPPPPPQPPIGEFYYLKKIGKESYIGIMDIDFPIKDDQLPLVFYPPSDKPYGLLDLKQATDPSLTPLKATFALVFNEELTNQKATEENVDATLIAVYDVMPVGQGKGKGKGKQKGTDIVSPANDDDDDDFGQHEVDDDDDEGKLRGKGRRSHKESRNRIQTGTPDDDRSSGTRTSSRGQETDLEAGEMTDEEETQETTPSDLMEALQKMVRNKDIVKAVKGKQQNLLNLVNTFSVSELRQQFYPLANVPDSTTKKEFISLVKTFTNPFFN